MSIGTINANEIQEAAQHLKAGNKGRLAFGGQYYRWTNQGFSYEDIKERLKNIGGVDAPSKSTVSKQRSAYEAWVANGGLDPEKSYTHKDVTNERGEVIPITLSSVAIEKLYLAKDLVTPESAQDVLAQVFNLTEQEVKLLAKGGDPSEADADIEPEEPTHKSLTLETAVYEAFLLFVNRLRSVTGYANLSKTQALTFAIGELDSDAVSDEDLDFLWRQAHGELTEEEEQKLSQEAFDVAE